MRRNDELDRLKSEEEEAYRRKQEAYKNYQNAKKRTDQAYNDQQIAWNERVRTRDEMNHEFEILQIARNHNDAVWNEYKRIRDNNNSRIGDLKPEADLLYQKMSNAFQLASDSYNYGSKAAAADYSSEGKEYQKRLAYINEEIRRLGQEVKNAKMNAEIYGGKTDSSKYNYAKSEFQRAKTAHESAQSVFKSAKVERDRLKAEFQLLHAQFLQKKEAFQAALKRRKDVKEMKQHSDETLMSRAGVPLIYQHDCKVVEEADGTVNFYFGGIGEKDGILHGHISMDASGQVTYSRMPMDNHGRENFTDERDLALNDLDAQIHGNNWGPVTYGWVDDGDDLYPVTFQQGKEGGRFEDHTLIADGFISEETFVEPGAHNHNHYGTNVYPNRTGRVEDPENGGDRGKYTGPGN